jgi:3-deoxy-D-manno-octulosonic-acid transferase
LVRIGGQNLLEPCAVGVPTLFGPHMFHFEEISALVLERGAGRQVHDEAELVAAVLLYLEHPELRAAAAAAGRGLVAENRGALARTLELVGETLRRREPRLGAPLAVGEARVGRGVSAGKRSSI